MDELDDDDFNKTGDELDSEDDIEEANFTGLCNSFIDECQQKDDYQSGFLIIKII